MEPLSIAIEARVTEFNQGIAQAVSSVQNFGTQAGKVKPVTLQVNDVVSKTLTDLNSKLRVAQGNVELFGNEFEGGKLKLVAYQQAINNLLAQGISPTNKEVLKLADSIETLSKELEQSANASARADLFASFQKTGRIIPDLEAKAQRLRTALRNATDEKDIERYNKRLQVVNNELAELSKRGREAAMNTAGGMNRLAGSAGTVNMEIARIVQDAPYGMMGIGNNIQQLTANFGQLSQQAGGAGGAIKATLASLITPASLLTLGIAALTSGWVLYEKWQQKAAKSAGEGANALTNAKKATEEYITSLNALTQSRLTGERDAQKELQTLRILYERTQDLSVSTKERKEAAGEILKQYPEHFKGLSTEEVLVGKAKTAYDSLSQSLLANAKARAALSLIEDKAKQNLVDKQKQLDLERQLGKEQAKLDGMQVSESAAGRASESGAIKQLQQVRKAQGAIAEAQEQINELKATQAKRNAEILQLEKEIGAQLDAGANLTGTGGNDAKVKEQTDHLKRLREEFNLVTKQAEVYGSSFDEMGAKAKAFQSAIDGLLEQGLKPNDTLIKQLAASYEFFGASSLKNAGTAIQTFLKQDLNKLREELAKISTLKLAPIQLPPVSAEFTAIYNRDVLEAMRAQVEIDMAEIGLAAQQAFAQGLGNVAELLGQAMAGTQVSSEQYVAAFLMPFADMAITLGKYAIGIGLGVEGIQKSLATMNPAAAIAAGVALVALGSAAKAALSNMAKGGSGAAPSVSTASGTGGYRQPGTSYEGPVEVKFRIDGMDLVGVLDKQNNKTRRIRG